MVLMGFNTKLLIKILLIFILCMTSSTESKLKSKYDSSSRKIQELYEEFSVMRKNMCTPSKKNKVDEELFNTGDKLEREDIRSIFQVHIPRGPRLRQYSKPEGISTLNFQTQVLLKNAVLKKFTTCFMDLDKSLDERVCIMESRLVNLRNLFSHLTTFYRLKTKSQKNSKAPSCKCSQIQQILKQVQMKYNKKISEMASAYQQKISLLVKEHQQTSDSSNSKNIPKEVKDQLQKLEDKLIVKEQEITNLMKEGSRLRRAVDQQKLLVAEKESLVDELTHQVEEKSNKIIELTKLKLQKATSEKKQCQECSSLNQEVAVLTESIEKLKKENSSLEQLVTKLKRQQEQRKKQQTVVRHSSNKKSDWDLSDIEKQELAASDYEDDDLMARNLKVDHIEQDYQPLRHTQYFATNTRKGSSYKYQQKLKELQSQLQLVVEQNKLLKSKKDKFEQQCKDNEDDQQKFQMQCQILRDQLKNVNTNIKILDECAIMGLKEKKVPEETVDKLSSNLIKYKEEYFKKYPKKKKSVKS